MTSKCDLDLYHRVMGIVHDTPTHHDKHFDQFIWKCNNDFWSYSSDKVGRTDMHSKVANCGNYVSLTTSRLNKKGFKLENYSVGNRKQVLLILMLPFDLDIVIYFAKRFWLKQYLGKKRSSNLKITLWVIWSIDWQSLSTFC